MKTLYSAILALRSNDSIDSPYLLEFMPELIATTFELKRREIVFGVIQIRFLKKVPKSVESMWHIKTEMKPAMGLLKLDFKVDIEKVNAIKKIDPRENLHFYLEKIIYHLFVVLNIAKPSAFLSYGGIFYSKGKVISRITPIYHTLEFAFEKSLEINWPKLHLLDIKKVWDWYFRFESDILELTNSPTGRALNALSHVFHDVLGKDSYADILWIMIGLEALYCQGNSNLLGQLNVKSALLLGERVSFKKEFNKMYDYRSRFVHGDLNFQNQYMYVDSSEKVEQHLDDFWSVRALALATFIATIQRLVMENWSSISFEYVLKGESHP